MDKRIIVALDFPSLEKATLMSKTLGDRFGYKVGMQLNTAAGTPQVLDKIGAKETFLDLKFHDIPNTVHGAVRAAAFQGVWMLNVHCLGGEEMMKAAVKAVNDVHRDAGHRTLAIGVTILTSHDEESLVALGFDRELSVEQKVRHLARLAFANGLDGIVCSPLEIRAVREEIPNQDFLVVTPGIRSEDAPPDDQKRTMTAREASDLGATHLVIGRPITQAPDPVKAAEKFLAEIS